LTLLARWDEKVEEADVVVHFDAPIFEHDLVQHRSQELLLLFEGKLLETTITRAANPSRSLRTSLS
jgi:hypothetical protein